MCVFFLKQRIIELLSKEQSTLKKKILAVTHIIDKILLKL